MIRQILRQYPASWWLREALGALCVPVVVVTLLVLSGGF